ncbi:MAG: 50S ribosomal protein L3 [Candidatus Omnitrophota bacterium]
MISEIFGTKLGITQIFDENADLVAVTLIEIPKAVILEEVRYPSKSVLRIACFKASEKKASKFKKPVLGYFRKMKVAPYSLIREVLFNPKPALTPQVKQDKGPKPKDETAKPKSPDSENIDVIEEIREIGIEIFSQGELVDVSARTKGRGFAGGMKRHGWAGQPKSHGSTTHRRIGSVGQNTFPGRIFKGLRMHGHMGNDFRTSKNLRVVKIDEQKNILFIKGSVAGFRGTVVKVKKVKVS